MSPPASSVRGLNGVFLGVRVANLDQSAAPIENGRRAHVAFESFAEHSYPALLRLALGLAANRDEAQDLVQAGLLQVYLAWHRLETDEPPYAYAFTVITRLNLNHKRRRSREAQAFAKVRARSPVALDSMSGAPQPPDWLIAGLATLSVRQRSAVTLVHAWGYSIDETAELMACSRNSVRTHLARGLQTLRKAAVPPHAADKRSDIDD